MNKTDILVLEELRSKLEFYLSRDGIVILPPMEIKQSSFLLNALGFYAQCCILDPWYNKGVGGVRDDYDQYIPNLLNYVSILSDHVYLWGFPEIVARFVRDIPEPLILKSWLTWYYKNSPSRIRGWRSAQMACLHLTTPNAIMHVENFLNDIQREKLQRGKLLYVPGPPSVIEDSLLCGFVGKNEQTGHPSQKPVSVIEKLILMATSEGELSIDLMSGSGTTAVACQNNKRYAIICDISEEYTQLAESRLSLKRFELLPNIIKSVLSMNVSIPKRIMKVNLPYSKIKSRKITSALKQLELGIK